MEEGGSDSHLYTIEGLIYPASKLILKYGFDSLLCLSSGLLTLISKKSVALFFDAYSEVRCIIFDECSYYSGANSKRYATY